MQAGYLHQKKMSTLTSFDFVKIFLAFSAAKFERTSFVSAGWELMAVIE